MDATGWLVLLVVVIVIAVTTAWSYRQYRRKSRIAQAKSRAALNMLLAEADRIERGEDVADD